MKMNVDTGNEPLGVNDANQMHFREFFNGTASVTSSVAPVSYAPNVKMWRLEKEQAIDYWQSLKPNNPIIFNPIKAGQKGSTFSEDGIRLTGSSQFIDSILGRLKDIMQYENPSTKLNIAYRQVKYKGSNTPDKSSSFVFYAQVKNREKKNTIGIPNGTSNTTPSNPAA
jgi:hypothetical protein